MIQYNPAPSISVVMPVNNGERYLREALESILAQSCPFSEFIIINDASTDSSLDILRSYQGKDYRITIINNQQNLGTGISRNIGVAHARGEFIALMDADDISTPDRFQKQIVFLEAHPEIWVLGGNNKLIDDQGKPLDDFIYPKDANMIRWNMLLGSGRIVRQGAAMLRRSLFDLVGTYGDVRAAEDFEFWTRLFSYDPLPIANLDEVIYYYRMHDQMISKSQKSLQESKVMQFRKNKIEAFIGKEISREVVPAYRHPALHYIDIRPCILTWINVYEKFVSTFHVEPEMQQEIFTELLNRINKYVYFNPLSFHEGQVFIIQIMFSMPIKYTLHLYRRKMQFFE